jgi:hypothetical protein
MQGERCLQSHNNLHRRFQVHHQKWGRLITKLPWCKNLEKCDNIKLEGDQLQDERTLLVVRNFHHEDVASMSNLEMTLKSIFHSLM